MSIKVSQRTVVLRDGFRVGVTQVWCSDEPRPAKPLVFLHGLSVSGPAYIDMLKELARQGFAVTALDAPNHGRSGSLPWDASVQDMARIVRQALDRLMIMGKAVVVGHSMGGGIAVEYAAMFPGNVEAVIAMDAACGAPHHDAIRYTGPSPSVPLRAAQAAKGAVEDLIGDGARALRARSRTERLSLLSTLRSSVSGLRCIKAAWALMRSDTEEALKTLRRFEVPTVHVHGAKDKIIDMMAAIESAMVSGGQIVIVPGAYHSWMIVDPRLGATIIANAVQRLERAA